MRAFYLTIVLICATWLAMAQTITGQVVDEKTNEPLAFVNLILSNGNGGATTDIDGNFKITIPEGVHVKITYVGYEPQSYYPDNASTAVIKLKSKAVEIGEVVIVAGENPADIIMRKLIRNKNTNNPEKKSHKFESYNKTVYSGSTKMFPEIKDPNAIQKNILNYVDNNHLLVMETVNELIYQPPNKKKETVLANKMSGFSEFQFILTPTDFQPFTVYKDFIKIMDKNYLSPICNSCVQQYFYNIKDTLYEGNDSVFILSYQPSKGKNFEGLKGVLYINSNGYALQNLIAEPANKKLVGASIQQKYVLVDGKHWFPSQLNSTLEFYELGMKIDNRSYIKNVVMFPVIDKGTFDRINLATAINSNTKDSLYWIENRATELTEKEIGTYQNMQKMADTIALDDVAKFAQHVRRDNGIPIGKITLPFERFVNLTEYEGLRLGTGIYTNYKLSRYFKLGGFGAYGFKDDAFKYGGSLEIYPTGFKQDLLFHASYDNDVYENGKMRFLNDVRYSASNLFLSNVHTYKNYTAAVQGRFAKFVQARVELKQSSKSIKSNYSYKPMEESPYSVRSYTNNEAVLKMRYAYGERFTRMGNFEYSLGTKFPVIWVNYTKAFKTWGGDFDYSKVEAMFQYTFPTKAFGETILNMSGGKTFGDALLPDIYFGDGVYAPDNFIYESETFQTMGSYEFLSDEYLEIHINHNFKYLLFGQGKFAPQVELIQSVALGRLTSASQHNLIDFNTLEKGYFESGILFRNIIKFNVMNIGYGGLGGGAFYRWGDYAYAETMDNIVFKATMDFEF